jgi:transporter family-2 protein
VARLGEVACGAAMAADPAAAYASQAGFRQTSVGVPRQNPIYRRDVDRPSLSLEIWSKILKATLWFVAIACGCAQVVQAMSNGSAVRSGIGAIWVGAMSATVSTLTLTIVALAIYRLPLPDTSLLAAHGIKIVIGGMMGAVLVAGLAFVAPKLGPTQTFILYFLIIAIGSALIDSFGLLGTEAKPLQARQLVGVLLAVVGLVLARA